MGKASREKGKRGEREWARFCRDQGYDCNRTAQYRGNTGDAGDVEGLPGIHMEVKRTETLRPWEYMEQAMRDSREAGKGQLPIVAWKKNNHPWLVMMPAKDWFQLYREWEAGHDERRNLEAEGDGYGDGAGGPASAIEGSGHHREPEPGS